MITEYEFPINAKAIISWFKEWSMIESRNSSTNDTAPSRVDIRCSKQLRACIAHPPTSSYQPQYNWNEYQNWRTMPSIIACCSIELYGNSYCSGRQSKQKNIIIQQLRGCLTTIQVSYVRVTKTKTKKAICFYRLADISLKRGWNLRFPHHLLTCWTFIKG